MQLVQQEKLKLPAYLNWQAGQIQTLPATGENLGDREVGI